jgi:hypothetical protein
MRHYTPSVARLRDERRMYLVEQIGANRKKDTDGKKVGSLWAEY